MNDFIFNVLPAQGPIVWMPIIGTVPINSPLMGSFLGVIGAFVVGWLGHTWSSNRLNFEEEYRIKAELQSIEHDLKIGGRSDPIMPIYGADHVIKYRLFGENRTEVAGWYRGFEKYNYRLEDLKIDQNYAEIESSRRGMANLMGGILRSYWLKRIPGSTNNKGLSRIKFIRYLFGLDALKEPIIIKWWQIWKIMTFSEMLKLGSRCLQFCKW